MHFINSYCLSTHNNLSGWGDQTPFADNDGKTQRGQGHFAFSPLLFRPLQVDNSEQGGII